MNAQLISFLAQIFPLTPYEMDEEEDNYKWDKLWSDTALDPNKKITSAAYGLTVGEDYLIIDKDVHQEDMNGHKAWTKVLADSGLEPTDFFNTLIVKSGGKPYAEGVDQGQHIYLKLPRKAAIDIKLKRYPGIDFKTGNTLIFGPGSLHRKTKELYTDNGIWNIKECPEALLTHLEAVTAQQKSKGIVTEAYNGKEYNATAKEIEKYKTFLKNQKENEPMVVGNRFEVGIKCIGTAKRLGVPMQLAMDLMLEYLCTNLEISLRRVEKNFRTFYNNPIFEGTTCILGEFIGRQLAEYTLQYAWTQDKKGLWKKGKVLDTLDNMQYLFKVPEQDGIENPLFDLIYYDVRSEAICYNKMAPWHVGNKEAEAFFKTDNIENQYTGFPWNSEIDYLSYEKYLSNNIQGWHYPRAKYEGAILEYVQSHRKNKLADFLKERSITYTASKSTELLNKFVEFAGVQDDANATMIEGKYYINIIMRKFMLYLVQRIFEPGCFVKMALVLQGEQGSGKSPWAKIIGLGTINQGHRKNEKKKENHPGLHVNTPFEADARRMAYKCAGRLIVEIDEGEGLKESPAAAKAAIGPGREVHEKKYKNGTLEITKSYMYIITINNNAQFIPADDAGVRYRKIVLKELPTQPSKEEYDDLWQRLYALEDNILDIYTAATWIYLNTKERGDAHNAELDKCLAESRESLVATTDVGEQIRERFANSELYILTMDDIVHELGVGPEWASRGNRKKVREQLIKMGRKELTNQKPLGKLSKNYERDVYVLKNGLCDGLLSDTAKQQYRNYINENFIIEDLPRRVKRNEYATGRESIANKLLGGE